MVTFSIQILSIAMKINLVPIEYNWTENVILATAFMMSTMLYIILFKYFLHIIIGSSLYT